MQGRGQGPSLQGPEQGQGQGLDLQGQGQRLDSQGPEQGQGLKFGPYGVLKDQDKDFTYSYLLQVAAKPIVQYNRYQATTMNTK